MKTGFRTPNINKSFKARTTGKLTRAAKRAVNPTYGKKGMGYIKNPKRAIYNSVYKKTTVGVSDIVKTSTSTKSPKKQSETAHSKVSLPAETSRKSCENYPLPTWMVVFFTLGSIALIIMGALLLLVSPIFGALAILFAIVLLKQFVIKNKREG